MERALRRLVDDFADNIRHVFGDILQRRLPVDCVKIKLFQDWVILDGSQKTRITFINNFTDFGLSGLVKINGFSRYQISNDVNRDHQAEQQDQTTQDCAGAPAIPEDFKKFFIERIKQSGENCSQQNSY